MPWVLLYNGSGDIKNMIVPKEFAGLQDLEAMLLTSMLGIFEALKEDLISLKQAENYWLSDFMADLFEQMKLSSEFIALIQEGTRLKELQPVSRIYYDKLDELIASSKQLIARYYTEYDDENDLQVNNLIN